MANVSRLNGFSPVGTLRGGPLTLQGMRCYHAAGTTVTHDLFVGDLVTMSGTGDAAGVPGILVATAGAANAVMGVIIGFESDPDHLDRTTWIDGATAGYALVCCDPTIIYEAQADEAVAITSIGQTMNMAQTAAGSRTAGTSGQSVDATIASALATWQLRCIGFPQRDDNTVNETYNRVLVVINNSIFVSTTGGATI